MFCLSLPSCVWLLEHMSSQTAWTVSCLLECPNVEVRRPIGLMIVQALETVLKAASACVSATASSKPADVKEGAAPTAAAAAPEENKYLALCTRFVDSVLKVLKFAPEHWKKFDMYFRVLYTYASFGPAQAAHLVCLQCDATMCVLG
jgi:hypothetical protein